MTDTDIFLQEALRLAYDNVAQGGRPFGAVVVKDGKVVATGVNEILATNDPTAHAELTALRKAGAALGAPDLLGCTVYASGQPCPMCMAAMRMAGVSAVAYAYSNEDGAPHGLSTAAIAAEFARPAAEQALKAAYVRTRAPARPDLYAVWEQRQA
jgi:guanine deaminase